MAGEYINSKAGKKRIKKQWKYREKKDELHTFIGQYQFKSILTNTDSPQKVLPDSNNIKYLTERAEWGIQHRHGIKRGRVKLIFDTPSSLF